MTAFPNHAALDYDERIARLVPGYGLAQDLTASLLAAARLPTESRILVPGCGTGAEIAAMARSLPTARFTAQDPSPGMLNAAREKLADLDAAGRVTFHDGFLRELAPIRHDAATLFLVLHFLPDDGAKQTLLDDMSDRLEEGAPIVVLDPLAEEVEDGALESWLALQGHGSDDVQAAMARMRTHWHRIPRDCLLGMLSQAGFSRPMTFFRAFDYEGILAWRAST